MQAHMYIFCVNCHLLAQHEDQHLRSRLHENLAMSKLRSDHFKLTDLKANCMYWECRFRVTNGSTPCNTRCL